jgi:signal transduction histidine kinase
MHNLVKNAIQSVPDQREAEILVSVNKDGRNAHIRVRDNGEGIPKEMQERVFEPNFTTKSSGMGLGLAMVKNLIENFGGNIRFETSSEGTEFIIELPITTE